MNNRHFNITSFITAALLTSCCFLSACENKDEAIKTWTERVIMKEEAIDMIGQLSQDGKIKARLKAPLMWRVAADTLYVEFPKTLHCDFYNDSTQIETWLDCKYGKYFESLNKVYLRDSVVVISVKGDTLKTPDLWWDQNTRLFYTDKPAEYLTKDKKLYPQHGLEATQDFRRVTFKEPTGVIKVKEGSFPQ
jgi:Lipopolysaccharide-assembly, LptC-related